jgi:RNA polymerase sigma factor (sigma-70 family)
MIETPPSDGELLGQFLTQHDEAAFATLLRRHGRMVWNVCRRHLGQHADAEDVFQATFLVLTRNASHIRNRQSLASWLHGVAYRLATRARQRQQSRRIHEQRAARPDGVVPSSEASWRELQEVLDRALSQLPEKYRNALVLCYLEGKTQEETARLLGCPLGTARSWLMRGRALLQRALVRQGITLSAGTFIALACSGSAARCSPSLQHTTLTLVGECMSKGESVVPSSLAALLEEGPKMILTFPAKLALVLSLTVGILTMAVCTVPLGANGQKQGSPQPPRQASSPASAAPDPHAIPLPPQAKARLGSMRFRHGSLVTSVAFSPDGQTLASGSWDSTVRLIEVASGKEIQRINCPDKVVGPVAFSPDGKLLAIGATEAIRLWDTSKRKEVAQLAGHDKGVASLAFSPDGRTLASGGWDYTVRLWDVASGKQQRLLGKHDKVAYVVAYSPDGKILASGSRDQAIILWDPTTGKRLRQLQAPAAIEGLAFSPDGKLLASGGYDKVITFWDPDTGKKVRTATGPEHWVLGLAFSPDGKSLAAGSVDKHITVWDVATGKQRRRWKAHQYAVFGVKYSPDGSLIASAGEDQTIALWKAGTGKLVHRPGLPLYRIQDIAYSPDGRLLASASPDDGVALWEVKGKKKLRFLAHPGTTWAVAFSPEGGRLVSAGEDGTVFLWEVDTGKRLLRYQGPAGSVSAVAFSPDGQLLAAGGAGSQVHIWEAVTGKRRRLLKVLTGPGPRIFHLSFARGGKQVVVGVDNEQAVRVYDWRTGEEVRGFATTRGLPALSADGQTLATVDRSGEGKIRVWEMATGGLRTSFPGGADADWKAVLSPRGTILATWTYWDRTITLWNVATGKELVKLAGHRGALTSLAFSPDGTTLASGSHDNTILLWDVEKYQPARSSEKQLSPEELQTLWDDLADRDASRAFRALCQLVEAPRQTTRFLKGHLHPAPRRGRVDREKLAHLLRALDSDAFAVRAKAAQDLEDLGPLAEEALRNALEGKPSAEVRRQCQRLLKRLSAREQSLAALRTRRALEALEKINSREAREILNTLTRGDPDAPLTQTARRILMRITTKRGEE